MLFNWPESMEERYEWKKKQNLAADLVHAMQTRPVLILVRCRYSVEALSMWIRDQQVLPVQIKVFGTEMLLFNLKSFCNIKLTLSFQAALPGWQVFIRNLMEDSFVRHNKLTLWTLIKLGLHWLYKLKEHSTSSWGQTLTAIYRVVQSKNYYTMVVKISIFKFSAKINN